MCDGSVLMVFCFMSPADKKPYSLSADALKNTVTLLQYPFPPPALSSSGSRGLPATTGYLRLCLPQGIYSILLRKMCVKKVADLAAISTTLISNITYSPASRICGWIWLVRLSKTEGITGYFEDFVIEEKPKTTRR